VTAVCPGGTVLQTRCTPDGDQGGRAHLAFFAGVATDSAAKFAFGARFDRESLSDPATRAILAD
jgi:hypothetical protein